MEMVKGTMDCNGKGNQDGNNEGHQGWIQVKGTKNGYCQDQYRTEVERVVIVR